MRRGSEMHTSVGGIIYIYIIIIVHEISIGLIRPIQDRFGPKKCCETLFSCTQNKRIRASL